MQKTPTDTGIMTSTHASLDQKFFVPIDLIGGEKNIKRV